MDNYKLMISVFPHIKWPSKWNVLIKLVERCVHETKVTIVALSNPGRLGVGGILRDQKGHMKLAFATPMREGTNNQAELEAAIFGMTWSIHLGYKKVILEVDSQLLVDWIMLKAKSAWSISIKVQQLQELIN
ncbi:hypothetical protein KY284_010824 [Solanum tuberosum]|nr:hypothetical protein KY284_010824 [Solanum tuberosum]